MPGNRDDELARTATALPSTSAPAPPADPIGSTLGRYRLERELGAGGMGVVHAAFDPDLERRIALKVLRTAVVGGDAEKRLLREARAMARLVHPNVITVHEVGSASGRDYVAMELVEGETLADWLRAARRSEAEILEAFFAAGRGLAAAHAAGIVHRDFKPHNVLRSRNGRIVVTDFGLAREAQELADPLAATHPLSVALATTAIGSASGTPSPAGSGTTTPSSPLAGLTVTGSLLGTPAYMAPEQWTGGAVTPATDQFAFCVALWEALAGERPFHGATVEALREAILRGPAALDDAKIPRRLRRALRCGLDPVPSRRWRSMEALLAAMTRRTRPVLALSLGAVVAVGSAIAVFSAGRSTGRTAVAVPSCAPPVLDPGAVWSDAANQALATRRPVEARMLAADFAAWRAARERTCAADPVVRAPRLTCLDGVLVRLDVVARAIAELPAGVPPVDAGAYTIDPVVCEAARVPRLATTASPQLREVVATTIREDATPGPFSAAIGTALVARVASDPCAAAWARMLVVDATEIATERDRQLAEAEQDAERCSDDRVRAEVATGSAQFALAGAYLGTTISSKVKLAELAVERVVQRDATAAIDRMRMEIAKRADNLDEAIARAEAAMAGYAARGRTAAQLEVGLRMLDLRDTRSRPDDLALVHKLQGEWRQRAAAELGEAHPIVRRIDALIATREILSGDAERGHAELVRLRQPVPTERVRRISGRVVDPSGAPVAGAEVFAGPVLFGTSLSVAVPFSYVAGGMRLATTDERGAFEIPDGPEKGVVVAQRGALRSLPVAVGDRVALALEPTSRIEGKVDLRGEPANRVIVTAHDLRVPTTTPYEVLAPVQPDGSFVLDGVPRGRVRVFASIQGVTARALSSTTIDVRGPVARGVEVAVASTKRVVHVLVRSTVDSPVANAQVLAFPGVRASSNLLAVNQRFEYANIRLARQIEGEHAPPPVVGAARRGDLFASVSGVPEGAATACAIGLPPDLSDPSLERTINEHMAKIEVRCVPIPPGAEVVVVEVPPWPRFD